MVLMNLIQFGLVAQSCLTLCDPMDCSTAGFPVHHQLRELAQTHGPIAGQQWPRRHREQTCGLSGGRWGGGTNWESSMETCTLPCVKQIACRNLLHDAGSSNQVLCDNLEGWDGVEGRTEVQEGGNICTPMADSWWCMAETNIIL